MAAQEIDFDQISSSEDVAVLRRVRVVPASPSYFTGKPRSTDHFLLVRELARKYKPLPRLAAEEAQRVAFKTHAQYKAQVGEKVKAGPYGDVIKAVAKLHLIHPKFKPKEVEDTVRMFLRDINPYDNVAKPGVVDEFGRAKGVGRRKTSSAVAWIVEGEGEVLINGKSLARVFGRIHDRESAIWALKATDRIDKYNVWALVKGGGVTGQAEALTLAVAKALLVHEPLLKPALRRGEFILLLPTSLYDISEGVVPSHIEATLTDSQFSWLRHTRCSKSGEKEAWQTKGTQDACLGSSLKPIQLVPHCFTCRRLDWRYFRDGSTFSVSHRNFLYVPYQLNWPNMVGRLIAGLKADFVSI